MTTESIDPTVKTRLELLNASLNQGKLADAISSLHEEFDVRYYTTDEGIPLKN